MEKLESKLKPLFFSFLLAFIFNCSGSGRVPSEVLNNIEKNIAVGMDTRGFSYLTYASGRAYDDKGHKYGWYVTGADGKKLSDREVIQTLVITNDKETKYNLRVDLFENKIISIKKK